MTRDTQRSKVYRAEHRLFRPAHAVRLTADETANLLHRISRKFYTSTPSVQWRGRVWGGGRYSYSLERITLYGPQTSEINAETVLHEYAHHLFLKTYGRGPGFAGHGPEFVRCLVEVMKWAGYFKGRFSMGRAKIRIAPPKPFEQAYRERRARKRS